MNLLSGPKVSTKTTGPGRVKIGTKPVSEAGNIEALEGTLKIYPHLGNPPHRCAGSISKLGIKVQTTLLLYPKNCPTQEPSQ